MALIEAQDHDHREGHAQDCRIEHSDSGDDIHPLRNQRSVGESRWLAGKHANTMMEVRVSPIGPENQKNSLDWEADENECQEKKDRPTQLESSIVKGSGNKVCRPRALTMGLQRESHTFLIQSNKGTRLRALDRY